MENLFLKTAAEFSAETSSGNGALKYSTTGNPFIDQFGNTSKYIKPRPIEDIYRDCKLLWNHDKEKTVKFIFYLRTISRKTRKALTNNYSRKSQFGSGLKHESLMRLYWLAQKNPETFYNNMLMFVSLGSWKDIFELLRYDYMTNGWEGRILDWRTMAQLIEVGVIEKSDLHLIKKYLPTIRSNKKVKTERVMANNIVGKYLANHFFGGEKSQSKKYEEYRKFKSNGEGHIWQQLITQGKHDAVNFDKIHGRALKLLVNSKYLKNNGQFERYKEWIEGKVKNNEAVKFTGFVHELFKDYTGSINTPESKTIDSQFKTLVNNALENKLRKKLIIVRDTSSSMWAHADGIKMSSGDIAKALAIYFAEFLEGPFKDHWIEFNRDAKLHKWVGDTPTEKWINDDSSYIGNTNFQSVIDLFVRLKNEGIPERDFPEGILCISDGEFDPADLNITNVAAAKSKLYGAGFSDEYVANFMIILWDLRNSYYGNKNASYETYGEYDNVLYFSGFAAETLSLLEDGIKNAEDLVNRALNQDFLNKLDIYK